MSNFNTDIAQLRGAILSPSTRPDIIYYVCFLDVPRGFKPNGKFSLVSQEADSAVIVYDYSGDDLPVDRGDSFETIALPVYTLQGGTLATQVEINCSNTNARTKRGASGTISGLNRIKPPIVSKINKADVTLTTLVLESRSSLNYYFVVLMAYTGAGQAMQGNTTTGGYSNEAGISVDASSADCLVCTLKPKESQDKGVVAIGIHHSSYGQFNSAYSAIPNTVNPQEPDVYGPTEAISYAIDTLNCF